MHPCFSWRLVQQLCGGGVEEPIQSLGFGTNTASSQSWHQKHNSPILTLLSVFKIKYVSVHLHTQVLIRSKSKAWHGDTSPCQQLPADLGSAQCNQQIQDFPLLYRTFLCCTHHSQCNMMSFKKKFQMSFFIPGEWHRWDWRIYCCWDIVGSTGGN